MLTKGDGIQSNGMITILFLISDTDSTFQDITFKVDQLTESIRGFWFSTIYEGSAVFIVANVQNSIIFQHNYRDLEDTYTYVLA